MGQRVEAHFAVSEDDWLILRTEFSGRPNSSFQAHLILQPVIGSIRLFVRFGLTTESSQPVAARGQHNRSCEVDRTSCFFR